MATDLLGERPLPYSLVLTREEYEALHWIDGRGYAAGLASNADEDDEDEETGEHTLKYHESTAWEVQEEYNADPDAFGACAADSLRRKMYAFLDSIV